MSAPATVVGNVEFVIAGRRLQQPITVSTAPMSPGELVPQLQELTNRVVHLTVLAVEERGQQISCKAGCGACCRQLVPVSSFEARRLAQMIDTLPEPRRSTIRARFAEARQRLADAGLLDKVLHPENWAEEEFMPTAMRYFYLGIPCPFLEDESCSIHPDRPLSCREYLVTSPAEHCAHPDKEQIDLVQPAVKLSNALKRIDTQASPKYLRWVPLIVAAEWAADHPETAPPRPGPELLRELIVHAVGKTPPAGSAPDGSAPGVMSQG
jgi:Fe-S-cluster containining protein